MKGYRYRVIRWELKDGQAFFCNGLIFVFDLYVDIVRVMKQLCNSSSVHYGYTPLNWL